MNYYERHLGDYAKDTGHLSMLEHGAYTLLLDRYYGTEQPIPAAQVYRICRAQTKQERAAVDAVLADFFTLEEAGWSNRRAAQEIEKFKAGAPDREAKRENERERQRRFRERRKAMFEELRSHGVVPPFESSMDDLQTLLSQVKSRPVTRDKTATSPQTPDTKQIPSDAYASGGKPPAPEPKDFVFAVGVPLLIAAGIAERNARSFLAMQSKAHGDERLSDAIQRCAEEKPVEPVSWLQAHLGPIKTGTKSRKHAGFDRLDYHEGVTADGHLA